jgi:thioredoxin 1
MSGLCGRSPDKKALTDSNDSLLTTQSASASVALAADQADGELKPKDIADSDFLSLITNEKTPVLVDFWAPWCAPCRKLAPTIDQLAKEYSGRAVVAKLNTQVNQRTPSQLGIRGIPTIIIFKNGKEVERLVGIQPSKAYQAAINKHL